MRFIGSKVMLLGNIKEVVDEHANNANTFCDIFSGTACVSRYFKKWYEVISNDLLYFSYCLQKGTVENDHIPTFPKLDDITKGAGPIDYINQLSTAQMEALSQSKRFFQNNYSPLGNRMYVTDSNALRIDYARNKIEEWFNSELIDENEYYYLIASTVEGIPYVSNISGTYGAYNRFWDKRSSKTFELIKLDIITNGKNNKCYNVDGLELLKNISGDILYIDPPYNSRQYPPNYHVLETAAKYDYPALNGVTGLRPYDDQKSDFCKSSKVIAAFDALIKYANFEHIILSYNTEGLMKIEDIEMVMKRHAIASTFKVYELKYRRFKSRSTKFKDSLKELIVYIRKGVTR